MKKNIAIFGSAFNPPTYGHLDVLNRLPNFDEVWLLPSIHHAWGKDMLTYETRAEMVQLFITHAGKTNWQLSKIEHDIYQGEPISTFEVLSHIQKQHKESQLTFVLGPDNLLNFANFYKCEEILQKWQVICCPNTTSIRSTDARLNKNKEQFVIPEILNYIKQHNLYEKE